VTIKNLVAGTVTDSDVGGFPLFNATVKQRLLKAERTPCML
jgi:hypothetical protein